MKTDKQIPRDLIQRWLDGTADKDEREIVAEWASECEENEKKLISEKMVYLASLSGEANSKDSNRTSRVRRIIY